MGGLPGMVTDFAQVMDLGMAVVAGRDAVGRSGGQNLVGFDFAVIPAGFLIPGLEESAAAAATKIVGPVGRHVDEIFFTYHGFDNKPEIFGHGVAKGFANELAGVLDREFDFPVLVPVGADFQLSFPDPLGVILNNAFDLEIKGNLELLRSEPDREEFVPSLGVEPDLAFKILHGFHLGADNMFPCLVIRHKHAIIFSGPSFGAVCPVSAHGMEDFPQRHHFIGFRHRFP
jgi:hypothetical protein